MRSESFFHVAIKVDDLDASGSFHREHFGGGVVERGDATDSASAIAVNYATLDIADKFEYIFDEVPYFQEFEAALPDLLAGERKVTALQKGLFVRQSRSLD